MALTYRDTKGQALTAAEFDANTRDLDQRPLGQVYPKTKGVGIKVDTAAPDWGWHDLKSDITLTGGINDPIFAPYIGGIEQLQMGVGKAVNLAFHIPHDYAMGTDVFVHFHWSHNSATITGGDVSGFIEASYAKGHSQGAFSNTITLNMNSIPASLIRYQHIISEGQISAALGAGGLIATENLEPDGMLLARLEMTGNTMDGGALVFLHQVDLHYQSTGMATKNKVPDFWT
jgi:hypothetical protein